MKKYLFLTIAFLLFFSIFFFSNSPAQAQNQLWHTIVGSPEPVRVIVDDGSGGTGGGSGTEVTCPSGNYRKCLADQFNITVAGSPRDSDLQATYRGYKIVSRYNKFYNAFKRGRITITYSTLSSCPPPLWCSSNGGAWATVDGDGNMTLYRNIWTRSVRYQNYFMIHEGAHVADDHMGRANEDLYWNAYEREKDKDCFNSKGIITTYPWSVITPPITLRNQQNESFAESVANTIQCRAGQTCGPNGGSSAGIINDWPNKCSWINKYILSVIN